jgi:hypothetical protein
MWTESHTAQQSPASAAFGDLARFYDIQPLATQVLANGLTQHRLSHGMVLTGNHLAPVMYQMMQQVYALMACEQPPTPLQACQTCRSCRWMVSNTHPGFITISPLSYFMAAKSDGSAAPMTVTEANKLLKHPPTQILVAQIRYLLAQLALSAGNTPRMAVFTDATQAPLSTELQPVTPPGDWASLPDADGMAYIPQPLQRRLFNASSANRILKTLEEPGPNTHFVFLTQQPEDVLPTILSRCQHIPFQSNPTVTHIPEGVAAFWHNWLTHPGQHLPHAWVRLVLTQLITPEQPAELLIWLSYTWVHQQRKQWVDPAMGPAMQRLAGQLYHVEEMLKHHVQPEHAFAWLFNDTVR